MIQCFKGVFFLCYEYIFKIFPPYIYKVLNKHVGKMNSIHLTCKKYGNFLFSLHMADAFCESINTQLPKDCFVDDSPY